MEITTERECSALGGLFQTIINDMKGSTLMWEDFISKASKLHSSLKSTLVASSGFLDSFQKVADSATNTKGATKDIGSALTRLCIRHKAIETKLKGYTSKIMDNLVMPLQDKMTEWKNTVALLDKDHAKEYKKARQEIKRVSTDTIRLKKKVKKGKFNMQNQLESAMRDVNDKYVLLEETEKIAVRSAMIEQRNRFCCFVNFIKPVVEEEISMLTEVTHLQEILESLVKHSSDIGTLPSSSEQVIADLKGSLSAGNTDSLSLYQTPPSSPSSLGSRKSSLCSINSLNSSSSSSTNSHSPSHQYRYKSQQQQLPGTMRLTSVSSQDSGFTSQDTLFLKPITPPPNHHCHRQMSYHGQDGNRSGSGSSSSSSTTPSSPYPAVCVGGVLGPGPGSQLSFPPPPSLTGTGTMSRWPDHHIKLDTIDFDRPHTISSAYEKSHTRPSLTAQTFEPPIQETPHTPNNESHYQVPYAHHHQQTDDVSVKLRQHTPAMSTTPVYRPSSINPNKPKVMQDSRPPPVGPKPKPKAVATPTVPTLLKTSIKDDTVEEQSSYVNMNELTNMAAAVAGHSQQEMSTSYKESTNEQDAQSTELADAIRELEASTAALEKTYDSSSNSSNGSRISHMSLQSSSGYGTDGSLPNISQEAVTNQQLLPTPEFDFPQPPLDLDHTKQFDASDVTLTPIQGDIYATLPRHFSRHHGLIHRHSIDVAGTPLVRNGTVTISRRASTNTAQKPAPPVRRSSSITYPRNPAHPRNRSRSRQRTDSGSSDYSYDGENTNTVANEPHLSNLSLDLNKAIAARQERSRQKLQDQPNLNLNATRTNTTAWGPSHINSSINVCHETQQNTDSKEQIYSNLQTEQTAERSELSDEQGHSEIINDVAQSRASLIQTLNAQFAVNSAPNVGSNQQIQSNSAVNKQQSRPIRRESLLDQITHGRPLKKTVTYDRSAPLIRR